MNQERWKGGWLQFKGEAEIAWGSLTGNRLTVTAGIRDQRAGRNQARIGISKENAARQLKEFFERNRDWNPTHH